MTTEDIKSVNWDFNPTAEPNIAAEPVDTDPAEPVSGGEPEGEPDGTSKPTLPPSAPEGDAGDAGGANPQGNNEPPAPPAPEIDLDKILSEKTGGKYTSLEQITQLGQKIAEMQLNEHEKKILDFYRNGGDPYQAMYVTSLDFEKMPEKEVLWTKYQADNPDLDAEVAKLIFDSEYDAKYGDEAKDKLEQKFGDNAEKVIKATLDKEVQKARNELKKWQQDYQLPKTEAQAQQATQAQLVQQLTEQAEKTASDFGALEVNLNGATVSVGVDKAALTEALKGVPDGSFWARFVGQDGALDWGKLATSVAYMLNAESVINEMYKRGIVDGKEAVYKEARNPGQTQKQTADGGQKATNAQAINKFFS